MLLYSLKRPRPSGHPTEHHSDELFCDIMLIRPDKKEVTSSLEDLVKGMHFKEWEMKPVNIQELATSVNYLGSNEACQDITSKGQTIASHNTYQEEESTMPVIPLTFGRQHIPRLGVLH